MTRMIEACLLGVFICGLHVATFAKRDRLFLISAPEDVVSWFSETKDVSFWGDSLLNPGALHKLGSGNHSLPYEEATEFKFLVFQKPGCLIEVEKIQFNVFAQAQEAPEMKPLVGRKRNGRFINLGSLGWVDTEEQSLLSPFSPFHEDNEGLFNASEPKRENEAETESEYSLRQLLEECKLNSPKNDYCSFLECLTLNVELTVFDRTKVTNLPYYWYYYSSNRKVTLLALNLSVEDIYGHPVLTKAFVNFGGEAEQVAFRAVLSSIDDEMDVNYDRLEDIPGFMDFVNTRIQQFLKEVQDSEEVEAYFKNLDEPTRGFEPLDIIENVGSKTVDQSLREAVATIRTGLGHGSGVVLSPSGMLVTNYHVIEHADSIKVTRPDGAEVHYELVRSNPVVDLALIQPSPSDSDENAPGPFTWTPVQISLQPTKMGDAVTAIGTPLDRRLSGSMSRGVVTGMGEKNGVPYLQVNAQVNGGNSGGGLFNASGELVGIVNAKLISVGVNNVGFAIPVSTLQDGLKITLE